MPFNFIAFTDTNTSFSARITIRQTGQMGFNAGAINRFEIHGQRYAVLYYDPDNRVVGIELTNQEKPGAIEIKQAASNTYVRSKNFCDKFGIDYGQAHRFEIKQDADTGFLYFELDHELPSTAGAEDGADMLEMPDEIGTEE